jgi:hypothetical protein
MQAPVNLPSCLSAPLQSMTAVAVVQTPRPQRKPHPVARTPHLQPRTAPPSALRLRRSVRLAPKRGQEQKPVPGNHRSSRSRTQRAARHVRLAARRSEPNRAPLDRALTANGVHTTSGHPDTDVIDRSHDIDPRTRHPDTSRRSHPGKVSHQRSSGESSAATPPRQCDSRCRCTPPRQRTPSIRFVQPASSVTAVQAHPSRSGTHIRRRRAEARRLFKPLRTHEVSKGHSTFRSPKRPET